uniref:Uncharacterized protein n=1 Tax=Anguilla anguilla TaxID=7936 RepID=A0A0E9V7R9_ANGAN
MASMAHRSRLSCHLHPPLLFFAGLEGSDEEGTLGRGTSSVPRISRRFLSNSSCSSSSSSANSSSSSNSSPKPTGLEMASENTT